MTTSGAIMQETAMAQDFLHFFLHMHQVTGSTFERLAMYPVCFNVGACVRLCAATIGIDISHTHFPIHIVSQKLQRFIISDPL